MSDLFAQPEIVEADIRQLVDEATRLFVALEGMPFHSRVAAVNSLRVLLHKYSPFSAEPVDCVQWIEADIVSGNNYNPNSVAPPEMKLLAHSITEDGYTQPIVAWKNGEGYEVVDGFHRNRVGRENEMVRARVHGYLPVTVLNDDRIERGDRIASTIRHNRARGKHRVEAMSDIVIELKRRNWSDDKIGRELGMDPDEVLRLCQITGLVDVFTDQEFSKSWDIADAENIGKEILSDLDAGEQKESKRVFHTWEKWECYPAGFYEDRPPGNITQDEGEEKYREFLSDAARFESALRGVISEWKHSCEHYLTNDRMNRIAWLGQASVAYALHIPSCCRGGYNRLTDSQKQAADLLALQYLNIWLEARGDLPASLESAASKTEANLY